ncbi:glycosyl transferase [Candidatus Cerribacteria bacterium 'Amazon FNV 2010 28 9']|uniref:Glycosyl transferase n=1 Tax=Candidatus Cerribacteria bacterium 'Amazon FNV 2010 28 9' TaxID=2081795 RepID=A0A317JM98_9BACT|nr:MAG: glycosyl transferase [Candidatus Cerribacteria bacterium 'Amazon FNV 2010 28 9']
MSKQLKVAIVHDYLREYGGAERVVEALHAMFPEAPLYTAFVDQQTLGIHWQRFKDWEIHESIASKIPFITKLYSPLRLFAAYFFEGFDLSDYDVVISSTNMYMAKAVLTSPHTLHICYCHTPPRSLYGYTTMSNWKKNPFTLVGGQLINFFLRKIDFLTAQRPDVFVANSQETKARIKKFYRRDAVVVYPPVSLFSPLSKGRTQVGLVASTETNHPLPPPSKGGEYYLYVNRLAYAKHPELAVQAATQLSIPLKVVGKGGLEEELRKMAGDTVEFCGAVNDEELVRLYQRAKALLYPVEDEDFGIVPVEAMMMGVPVIAHASGGPKETIIDGKTGVFFDELTTEGLISAVKKFETLKFNADTIKKHAQQFSVENFERKIKTLIERELKKDK